MTALQLFIGAADPGRQRLLRRRRVRDDLRPPQPDRTARRGGRPAGPQRHVGPGARVGRCWPRPSSASPLCTLVLGIVAEPAIAHLLEPLFHAVGVPDGADPPDLVRDRAGRGDLPAHAASARWCRRTSRWPNRCAARSRSGRRWSALTRALRPVIFTINAFANALLRLLRVETKDEVAAAFSDDQLARWSRRRRGRAAGRRGPPSGCGTPWSWAAGRSARWCCPPSGWSARGSGSPRRAWSSSPPSPASPASPSSTATAAILGYLHVKDALDADAAGRAVPARGAAPHRPGRRRAPRWTTCSPHARAAAPTWPRSSARTGGRTAW